MPLSNRPLRRLAAPVCALALGACAAVGPNFKAPESPEAAAGASYAMAGDAAAPGAVLVPEQRAAGPWWQAFGSADLDRVIRQALADNRAKLEHDPRDYVAGNPNGKVTLVEFFDYRCPYCKASLPELEKLLQSNKDVRLVLKEFPILGQDSVLASHAALAAVGQGKYWEFHQALMEHRGAFDMEVIKSIAAKAGLDPAKLEADMGQQQIEPLISANHKLAQTLDVSATPTFVIGDEVVEGAVPLERLKELIQKARGS